MKNLLEDIPEEIKKLESSFSDRYLSIDELRDHYRNKQFRSALSGFFVSENKDVRKMPVLVKPLIQGMGNDLPDFPSRYFEWLRRLPLIDIEEYADKTMRNDQLFPFITRSNQKGSVITNKIRQGIFPVSVLCRLPTEFISEKTNNKENRCEIKINNFQIMFIFHLQPNGLSAKQGFLPDNYRLRLFCKNELFRYGLIRYVSENVEENIRTNLCVGDYKTAIDSLLKAVNEYMRRFNFAGI